MEYPLKISIKPAAIPFIHYVTETGIGEVDD
jgi:hypothetical protein